MDRTVELREIAEVVRQCDVWEVLHDYPMIARLLGVNGLHFAAGNSILYKGYGILLTGNSRLGKTEISKLFVKDGADLYANDVTILYKNERMCAYRNKGEDSSEPIITAPWEQEDPMPLDLIVYLSWGKPSGNSRVFTRDLFEYFLDVYSLEYSKDPKGELQLVRDDILRQFRRVKRLGYRREPFPEDCTKAEVVRRDKSDYRALKALIDKELA